MPQTLLIIEDDRKLQKLLDKYLSSMGFSVLVRGRPADGLAALEAHAPDLVILDVMLPDMNGFDVCREIRKGSDVPVIMLTARGDVTDRVVGLEIGADDYVPKPFEPRELVARIQAVLRRKGGFVKRAARSFGRLRVEFEARQVFLDETPVPLTSSEFVMLSLLANNPGVVLDRDRLMRELRGIDSDAYNRSVDILMSRLRNKLGDDPKRPEFITTVWGEGYVFTAPEDEDAQAT